MYGWRNAQSLVGLALTMGLCWAVSEDRRRFPPRLAVGALAALLWHRGVLRVITLMAAGLSCVSGSPWWPTPPC